MHCLSSMEGILDIVNVAEQPGKIRSEWTVRCHRSRMHVRRIWERVKSCGTGEE